MRSCPYHKSNEEATSATASAVAVAASEPQSSERKRTASDMTTCTNQSSEERSGIVIDHNSNSSNNSNNNISEAPPPPPPQKKKPKSQSSSSSSSTSTCTPKKKDDETTCSTSTSTTTCTNSTPLTFLCLSKSWVAATNRAISHPHEAQYGCTSSARSLLPLDDDDDDDRNSINSSVNGNHMASSPLALATRYGAPSPCVEAILNAEKRMVRRCIPNRGTPLHEAIMLFPTGVGVGVGSGFGVVSSRSRRSPSRSSSLTLRRSSLRSSSSSSTTIANDVSGVADSLSSSSADAFVMTREEDPITEYVKIIRMLIKADESLVEENSENIISKRRRRNSSSSSSSSISIPTRKNNRSSSSSSSSSSRRATLMQDVDGNVPLHLLIRQAFYNYLGDLTPQDRQQQAIEQQQQEQHPIFTIAQELIQSSPDAVSIPDCTEFEETPLILALKSSVYANEQHEQHEQHAQYQQLMDEREQRPDRDNDFGDDAGGDGDDGGDDDDNNNNNDMNGSNNRGGGGGGGGIDFYNSTLERKIFDICKIMLQSSPAAASRVMVQNGYTAVHSAVFHGRCCDTIRLLLTADEVNRQRIIGGTITSTTTATHTNTSTNTNTSIAAKAAATTTTTTSTSRDIGNDADPILPATMQANKFGELPLHFAAMRGECTRSIALLSKAAPWAVLRRDVKLGLTPLHWLWVRFMDTMVERFGERSFNEFDGVSESDNTGQHNYEEMEEEGDNSIDDIVATDFGQAISGSSYFTASTSPNNTSQQHYDDNGHIHFDLEYHIRTEAIDPPVHYTRMRHIVPEHVKLENVLTTRVVHVLRRVRERHKRLMDKVLQLQKQNEEEEKKQDSISQDESSQIESTDSKTIVHHESKALEAASNNIVTCPYSHLRVSTNSETKCPFGNARNSQTNNVATLQNQNSDMTEIQKKCPFRCPFVFDSYPLNEDLMRPAEEEALREEQVISLFWAKVTSLLQAAALVVILESRKVPISSYLMEEPVDYGKIHMLHTACSAPCPFSIVRLCLELYPEQLMEKDASGKLPLHHVALRSIDPRERNYKENRGEENGDNNSTFRQRQASSEEESDDGGFVFVSNTARISANNIIQDETVKVLELLISSSPTMAARTFDIDNRLPLHCFIDTMMKSVVQYQMSVCDERNDQFNKNASFYSVAPSLQSIMSEYPDALECVDGKTKLYPFMQASAAAAESYSKYGIRKCSDNVTLSLVYSMLLEKPSIINMLL
mmetsp:Transcript_13607/g.20656  ORF Transcript_13607/g.20656 Transcript_13607/m.20656 type:complete len:1233 (+) Transcript_13607:216-3914(+)